MTKLEEDIKELAEIFKDLNVKTTTFRTNVRGTEPSLFRKRCDKLNQQAPNG